MEFHDKNGSHFLFVAYGGTKLEYKSTSTSTYAYYEDYQNEESKLSVKQLASAFYTSVYTSKFTSSSTAKSDYLIDYTEQDNKPSLDFSKFTTPLNSYYISEYFYLQNVCDALSTAETQEVFNQFKTIFNQELGNLVD